MQLPRISDNSNAMDNLISAKNLLKSSLETSKSLSLSLNRTAQRLEMINQRLSSVHNNVSIQNCNYASMFKDQIHGAAFLAMAVLKMCTSIKEMETSLLLANPSSDLYAFLLLIQKMEEALKFLHHNCGLAIQWLQGIKDFLKEKMGNSNDSYAIKIDMGLSILKEIKAIEERARFDDGILSQAFRKLEIEFDRLLEENAVAVSSPMPPAVLQKLEAILKKLDANNRISSCLSAYARIRSMNARMSLEGLGFNYVNMSITELDDVQDIQVLFNQWCNHLEFGLKYVFKHEHELINEVFDKIASKDIRKSCFAKIATQSGLLPFLQFGLKLTKCKKDPVKLLKLLDVFECLDKLRSDFNSVFAGEGCSEIQNLTRELIRKIIDGAAEIFFELPFQVKLQRRTYSPPSDGSVPRLVSFVTDYCNHLLDEDYESLLINILTIHTSWRNEKYENTLLTDHINLIIKEIGLNLDTWSQAYQDKPLSYLFMMNNHFHFSNLKSTKLGILMGDSWIEAHDQYKDYYMKLYLKETWGKILDFLGQDGDVKKILQALNEALDGMYEKQSKWVVANEELRLKICNLVIESFLPIYKNYLKNYNHIIAQEDIKYTAQGLESMLSSLFQPKIRMCGTIKHTHWVDEVKNIEIDHTHHFTLMAA